MQINTFNAFKSKNYRLYFIGQSVSLIGTWMQKTAVSWVVYSLTHSKFMLGVTLFCTMFPSFLFSFIGGIVVTQPTVGGAFEGFSNTAYFGAFFGIVAYLLGRKIKTIS